MRGGESVSSALAKPYAAAVTSVYAFEKFSIPADIPQGLEDPLTSNATDVEIGTGIGAGYLRNHDLLGARSRP